MDSGAEPLDYCRTEWDEVVPGLFIGGHVRRAELYKFSRREMPVHAGSQFDTVVSLVEWPFEEYGPDEGVEHIVYDMPDGPLTSIQIAEVCMIAGHVHGDLLQGRKVLVRCWAGYNRSALVTGAVLIFGYGYTADEAIELIRSKRSRACLHNPDFVRYLHEWERDRGQQQAERDTQGPDGGDQPATACGSG